MDFSNIACWIWPLIAGIICGILGYLLGRLAGGSSNSEGDIELWKRKNASLQADLDACNSKLKAAPVAASSSASMASSFTAGNKTVTRIVPISFDAAAAAAAFGKKIKQDDLTVVEGIGPKIAELFHNHDIKTWANLAETSVEKCQEVLNSGGKRFEIHRPATWPMQAELAALGKWDQLKRWQDEHDYGKE
ncbi:hypothetical protein EAX61_02880 [Dokdonia sinensis]|uniref:LSU ribosomal protein L21p n=1 Tax=Dokdonia sinensis TaxID=2479847 RepID=A0A3M0GL18_9FLAO|nr:hypothetical protein [Dokdonia sinensis]RMB63352.1 hypothetical protein EAX61_02880 [Dokdonia sinensis]